MRLLIVIAVIPIILILKNIYDKDINSEPKELLNKIFWYGVLMVIPVFIFELLLDNIFSTDDYSNYLDLFISVFCGIALIEEFFKWVVVRYVCYNNKEFDEVYDAIVYTTFSSLGFACLENLLYVLVFGTVTGIFRAFCAVPGHACYGVIMGYYLGLAKTNRVNGNNNNERKYLVLSILIPSLLHTLYDFMIFSHSLWLYLVWFIYTIILFIYSFKIAKKVSRKKELINKLDIKCNYCGNCGARCNTNYCENCGHKNM